MQEEGNVPLNKVYLLKVTLFIFPAKKDKETYEHSR